MRDEVARRAKHQALRTPRAALGIGGLCVAALGVVLLGMPAAAEAQIRSPGRHARYDVELEPHLVWQWSNNTWWDDDGIGVGLRASIPLIDNGPVRTINNNLAISFGVDWAHFDDACDFGPFDDNCDADDIWIPVVAQWNFFVSDTISLFPELGLAFQYRTWDWPAARGCVDFRGDRVCGDDTETDLELVLWLGARFGVSDDIAITLRLGVPSLLLGVSFLL